MALAMLSWLIALPLLGLCTGLRAMTPMALICWAGRLGYLPVSDTWASWVAHPVSVGVFTFLALGEYVGDKLPKTPKRITLFPLITRLAFGGLVGAIVATALGSGLGEAILLGLLGAAFGSFAGYHLRTHAVQASGWPDWRIAVAEDLFAIGASIVALSVVTG